MRTDKTETTSSITEIQNPSIIEEYKIPVLKKHSHFFVNSVVGFLIYLSTFFIWYFLKRSTFLLEDKYIELIIYYFLSLFVASILSNKAFLTRNHEYNQSLRKIYISILLALGMLSLILLETDASTLSRYVIIGSMLSGSVLESFYFYAVSENKSIKVIIDRNPISYFYTIPDLLLLTFSIYFFIIKNIGIENLTERHVFVLVLIYLSWNYSALFTHRYNPLKQSVNNWSATGLQLKFYLLILSSTSLFVFTVNIRPEYWAFFLQSIVVYSTVSFIIFLFLHVHKLPYPTDEVTNVFLKAFELGKPSVAEQKIFYKGKYRIPGSENHDSIEKQKMQLQYFKDFPEIFNFLERELELESFDERKALVIRSSDIYNIQVLSANSVELFVNLHEINDLKRVNDYFRLVNEKIIMNGIYAGCLIPIKNRYRIFQKKYPFLITNLFYFFDFIS
jgi:hypothetical protein